MEAAAGKKGCHGIRLGERADVGAIDFFKVVAARRMQRDAQLRRAGAGKLFGVEPWLQAADAPGRQDSPRLLYGERATVAEDVAILREAFVRDFRNQLLHDELDVIVGALSASAILRRNDVRAQEGRDNVERLRALQLAMNPQS